MSVLKDGHRRRRRYRQRVWVLEWSRLPEPTVRGMVALEGVMETPEDLLVMRQFLDRV